MTTYLLLRNNKESGPFVLNELRQFGLKPYDLVWVNGKSAAWRYPGEIEELKEFAPMVEEQPYDRFFKKPSETKKEEVVEVKQQQETVVPQPAAISSSYVPKKSVFVTLPGQKSFIPRPQTPEPETKKYEPIPLEQTISITENPVAAEIKYSQPLDEIKEMYVKTLQERKQKIANKVFVMRNLKKIAAAVAIVAVIALIGYSLKENLPTTPKSLARATTTEQPAVTAALPETIATEATSTEQLIEEKSPIEQTQREELAAPYEPVQEEKQVATKTVTEKPVVTIPKKESILQEKKEIPVDQPSPGVEMNARTGERNRKVRSNDDPIANGSETVVNTEPAIERKQTTANQPKAVMKSSELTKLVSVSSNEYQKVAFGGIRNLQLTVNNDSKYILDNVTVEVQYLKPSEEPLRTESVQFRSVAPGGTMTVRMPDTNRGIKVTYKITNILSTQSAKETAGL
jgi:hypothetical protein